MAIVVDTLHVETDELILENKSNRISSGRIPFLNLYDDTFNFAMLSVFTEKGKLTKHRE